MSELNNNFQQELKQSIQKELQQLIQNSKNTNSKLGSLSGFLTTMRSDNTEEHKIITNGLNQIIDLLKLIKKVVDSYFIFGCILFFYYMAKFTIKSIF